MFPHSKTTGPSSSASKNKSHSSSYAPFGSVSPRNRRKKKPQPGSQIGPGAYDISLPIIQPSVQTIRKKNNNIIVKLSHVGTSAFQGEQDRFKSKTMSGDDSVSSNVGPGKYSPEKYSERQRNSQWAKQQYQSKLRNKRRYAGIQLGKYIKNRERGAATIPQLKKIEIDRYVEMPAQEDNVLSKIKRERDHKQQLQQSSLKKAKGPCWSMMKEDRITIPSIKSAVHQPEPFQKYGHLNIPLAYSRITPAHKAQQNLLQLQSSQVSPGPGQYNLNVDNENRHKSKSEHHPSYAFRSESVRSFFDQIYFQTKNQLKAQIRQAAKYKSQSIGPGRYNHQNYEKKQKAGSIRFQFFGSTQQRRLR